MEDLPTTPTLTSEGNGFSTPKQVKHKRVVALKGGSTPALKVPASPLLTKMLGIGSGVGVFVLERSPKPTGELRSPWALKKVQRRIQATKSELSDRIEQEASLLKGLCHPNIIGFRGFTKNEDGSAVLAMEKAPQSLGDIIVSRLDEVSMLCRSSGDASTFFGDPFSPDIIQKVALDLGKALQYLHEEAKILHGDVKAANVLIFGDFSVAKLCDFGASKKIKDNGEIEGEYSGTEIWSPMEAVARKKGDLSKPITAKADIYSFGLTIYEMLAMEPPHLPSFGKDDEDSSDFSEDDSFFDNVLTENIGKRPPLPDLEFEDGYNLILALFYCCTEEDPSLRPKASDIAKLLSESN